MAEKLEYSAELLDAITPVLQTMIEALQSLTAVMAEVADALSTGFDAGTASAQVYADILEETLSVNEEFTVSIDESTSVLMEQTNVFIDNSDSVEANTAAKTDNAAATDALGESSAGGASSLMGYGLAVGMAGGYLFKLGLDSDTALTRVMALAIGSNKGADQIRTALQQMALDTGKSMDDLSNGLYDVVSSGFSAADSMIVLKNAAELAAIGGVDLHTVTNGLTAIMKDYNYTAQQSTDVTDMLMQGVRDGRSSFEDYSNAIGMVAETAHSAGFSLAESTAALSTLTIVFPDARRAGMDLSNLLRAIGIDSQKTGDAARKMGLQFDQTKFDSMSLGDRLQYLQQITGGNQAEMLKLTGGAAGYAAAQQLLNGNMGDYKRILGDVSNSQGALANSWETHEGSISAHIDHMGASLSVLADKLTQLAKPVINTILDDMAGMFNFLGDAIEKHGDIIIPILAGLAVVIGGVLVAALYSMAAAAVAAMAPLLPIVGTILLVGGALAGLGLLFKTFYDQSAPFRAAVDRLKDAFLGVLAPVMSFGKILNSPEVQTGLQYIKVSAQTLANVLENTLIDAINQVTLIFNNGIAPAIKTLEPHIKSLAGVLTTTLIPGIINVITYVTQGGAAFMRDLTPVLLKIMPLITQLGGFISDQLGKAIKAIMPDIQKAGQTVGQFAKDLGERLGPAINNIVGFITNVLLPIWRAAWPGIQQVFVGVWNVIKGVFEVAWNLVSGLIKIGLDIIGGKWGQAWQDIKDMFAGVWKGIQDILGGVLDIIGGYIKEALGVIQMIWGHIWNWIKDKVGGILNTIKNTVSGWINSVVGFFKQLGTHILQAIESGFNAIKQAIQGALNFIVGLFKWLYDHNIYFQMLVDTIRVAIAAGINWLRGVWQEISTWLAKAWKDIADAAGQAWGWVKDHIINPVLDAWNWLTGKINDLKNWLAARWQDIANDAKQLWTGFTNAISSTWSNITGWIHDHIVQPITDTIGKMVSDALNWGANLVNMFKQGIQNAWGGFTNWLKNTVGDIGKFLGFHSPPPEGPLSDSDTWMPNMIQMLTKGIQDHSGQLLSTASQTAKDLGEAMQATPGTLSGGALPGSPLLGVASLAPGALSPGGPSGQQTIIIQLQGGIGQGLAMLNPADRSILMRQIASDLGKMTNLQTRTGVGYTGSLGGQ